MPTKKKVIETEPEPAHTEQRESARNVSLLVSANGNYCKYLLKHDHLLFRDTLMFQTRIYQYDFVVFLSFLSRDAMHKRGLCHHAMSVCPSVCPSVRLSRLSLRLSVTFVYSVEASKHIFEICLPPGRPSILVFLYRTLWQYSDGSPLIGASNPGGVGKNRDFRVLSMLRPPGYQHGAASVVCCLRERDDEVFIKFLWPQRYRRQQNSI